MAKIKNKTILLKEFISSKSDQDYLPLFQKLFPDIQGNDLETITSLKLAIKLNRKNSALARYVTWGASRNGGDAGFSVAEMKRFFDNIISVASKLGPSWNPDLLEIMSSEIQRDWSKASSSMPNASAWLKLKQGKKQDITKPIFGEDIGNSLSGFDIRVFSAVVNPDNPSQIWQIGEEIEVPKGLSSDQLEIWWKDKLISSKDDLDAEFDMNSVRKPFRPQIALVSNIYAPDGTPAVVLPGTKNWMDTAPAQKWLDAQSAKVSDAYKKFAIWYSARLMLENGYEQITDSDFSFGIFENVEEYVSSIEPDWSLLEESVSNIKEADDFIKELSVGYPHLSDKIKQDIINEALLHLITKESFVNGSFRNLQSRREMIANIKCADDNFLDMLIDKESSAVSELFNSIKLVPFLSDLTLEDKKIISEIASWNGYVFNSEQDSILKNKVSELDLGKFSKAYSEALYSLDSEIRETTKQSISDTDWSDLILSYGINKDQNSNISFDEEGNAIDPPPHPFIRWIDRLSPPDDVKASTLKWVVDNETFNDLNRFILRQTDTDDAILSTELIDKLKNVMSASTSVMQENMKNGGWWSRVRKNMTSNEAVSPEAWADAFLEFQDHMLRLFDSINKQIDRDKIWLKHALDISDVSSLVNKEWERWIKFNAKDLMQERELIQSGYQKIKEGNLEEPGLNEADLSERKVEWNTKMAILESAQSMRDQIKKANDLNAVFLDKIKMSTETKERLQQRSMIFYWSTLNMFAGLQSIQRNTNSIYEQADMVQAMSDSFKAMSSRSFKEEAQQKEKLKDAFKEMATSDKGMQDFYKNIAAFQQDAVVILNDLNTSREDLQIDTIEVSMTSSESIQSRRKNRKTMTANVESDIDIAIDTHAHVHVRKSGPYKK